MIYIEISIQSGYEAYDPSEHTGDTLQDALTDFIVNCRKDINGAVELSQLEIDGYCIVENSRRLFTDALQRAKSFDKSSGSDEAHEILCSFRAAADLSDEVEKIGEHVSAIAEELGLDRIEKAAKMVSTSRYTNDYLLSLVARCETLSAAS